MNTSTTIVPEQRPPASPEYRAAVARLCRRFPTARIQNGYSRGTVAAFIDGQIVGREDA
jgi:hypothetical protein